MFTPLTQAAVLIVESLHRGTLRYLLQVAGSGNYRKCPTTVPPLLNYCPTTVPFLWDNSNRTAANVPTLGKMQLTSAVGGRPRRITNCL